MQILTLYISNIDAKIIFDIDDINLIGTYIGNLKSILIF